MSEFGPEMVVSVPKGWLCPVCGRVYAPFVTECMHCGKAVALHPSRPADMPHFPDGEGFDTGGWVDVVKVCKKCGGQMQWHKDVLLTSIPAKWEYRCKKCGNMEFEEIGTERPPYTITLNDNIGYCEEEK